MLLILRVVKKVKLLENAQRIYNINALFVSDLR